MKKLSKEHRKKISLALKGNRNALGHRKSEKVKDILRKASRGNKNCLGRKASIKTRKKMSKAQKGKKRTLKWKLFMSEAMRGDKCYNWKGGITEINNTIRSCFKYRQWRSDVFTRDNFTCQRCGKRGVKLNAHHIKAFSSILKENNIKTFEQAMDCEELWNINNGLTLCSECHKKTENYGSKMRNYNK